MASAVIVALPAVDDAVHKYSSEKVPHLTLLYLGDNVSDGDASKIREFVAHAASVSLNRFGLSVDYRGELGDKKADVLFFDRNSWGLGEVTDFRSFLLKDPTIKRLYAEASKFDDLNSETDWLPHLTMGYPETPALPDDREYSGHHYVSFDRLAVWTGDYEGLELRLDDESMSDIPMMHADRGTAFLKHYGKKGMKWGVRNDQGHEGEAVKTKKLDGLDKKWEQESFYKAHNAMADKMNNGLIDQHNSDPRWADLDLGKPENAAIEEIYMNEFFAKSDRVFMEELTNLGVNPSGTKHYVMREDENGDIYAELTSSAVRADTTKVGAVKHADAEPSKLLKLNRNELGFVTSLTEAGGVLVHYGKKGMKWGVITEADGTKTIKTPAADEAAKPARSEVQIKAKPGKYAQTKGGKDIPIHEDAIAALEGRQRAQGSTTDALSNAELRKVVERMNLEKQYTDLAFGSDRRSKGERFVAGLFGQKRYGPEKRRFSDSNENAGETVRSVMDDILAERKKNEK